MEQDNQICKFCGEEIKASAIKCKHCHSILDDSNNGLDRFAQYDAQRFLEQKHKSNSNFKFIVFGLLLLALPFIYLLNPTEDKFLSYLGSDSANKEIGELQSKFLADFLPYAMPIVEKQTGKKILQRYNFYLFSIFNVKLSILPNMEFPDFKFIGALGYFIKIDKNPASAISPYNTLSKALSAENTLAPSQVEETSQADEREQVDYDGSDSPSCVAKVLRKSYRIDDYSEGKFKEHLDLATSLNEGEELLPVTQYWEDIKTKETVMCSHGGYCWQASQMFDGKLIPLIELTNCKLGDSIPESEHVIGYKVEFDYNKNSPAKIKKYEVSKRLQEMGLCEACVGNASTLYLHKPHSRCAKLVKSAFAGEVSSIKALEEFPEYCNIRP